MQYVSIPDQVAALSDAYGNVMQSKRPTRAFHRHLSEGGSIRDVVERVLCQMHDVDAWYQPNIIDDIVAASKLDA